jgi:thioredoxin-related protein
MLRLLFSLLTIFIVGCEANGIKSDFDINSLSNRAKRTDAHIMIFLHKNHCGFCENMQKSIDSIDVKREIEDNFMFLSLNINKPQKVSYKDFIGTTHQFAKEFGVHLYPTIIFIDKNNKAIYSTVGYRKPKELLNILKFISSNSYKEMDLDTFKSDLEFQE